MVLVFDLDDTLYDEITFVRSGFSAVSGYLSKAYSVPVDISYALMVKGLNESGRGRIFDDTLHNFGLYSRKNVLKCISVYRNHQPDIQLDQEAKDCLQYFKNYPVYIVTDGNKTVQKNKLVALGLYDRVRFCFITHRYGVENSNPSPYCLFKICDRESFTPEEVVYIGDNPNKDFVGIKPLGFKTIRILKGQYKDVKKPENCEALYRINTLSELNIDLLNQIVKL